MKILEVFEKEPTGFSPRIQTAGCYIELEGKLLLLQKIADESFQSEKWGVPAGKLEKDETPQNAAARELFEETGIALERPSQMKPLSTLYIRSQEFDYTFHMFKIHLEEFPHVKLSHEHQNYKWVSINDIEGMSLVLGGIEAFQHYFNGIGR